MYHDLKSVYWWSTMKTDIARFVEECYVCAQVKAEHQKPYGSLHHLASSNKWSERENYTDFGRYVKGLCARIRFPTCWLDTGEKQFAGPEIVQMTVEKIAITREKLKGARDRHQMYAKPRRRPVTFSVGDRVYLKVSMWKGVIRFGKRDKLASRFIGPFLISEILNDQTVILDLPPELAGIHNTFNLCYLLKCKVDDETQIVLLVDLKVDLNKKSVKVPICIVASKVTKLRKKQISMSLICVRNRSLCHCDSNKGGWGLSTVPRDVVVPMRLSERRELVGSILVVLLFAFVMLKHVLFRYCSLGSGAGADNVFDK
ncbi:uncharacterized protein [Rutidosis leptorrhynchoides]|uniref:uncharacterized protein n=1 Tax=Rutidosis leptorrhynchoides TaxID=125765 RepID=UPI003A9A4EDD